jgi:hypothetical protein
LVRKGPKPDADSACHWCFKAKWRTQVDAFWDAGIAAGGPSGVLPMTRRCAVSHAGCGFGDAGLYAGVPDSEVVFDYAEPFENEQ